MLTPAFLDAARHLATVDRGDPDVLLAAALGVNDHPAGTPEDDVERGLLEGVRMAQDHVARATSDPSRDAWEQMGWVLRLLDLVLSTE